MDKDALYVYHVRILQDLVVVVLVLFGAID